MNNLELSAVMRSYSGWRCLFPLQSLDQFASFFSLCALCILALALVLIELDPLAPLAYVLVPAALGGTSPLFAVLPGRLVIRTRTGVDAFPDVAAALVRLGYVRAEGAGAAIRYRNTLPGWLHWKENEFSVAANGTAITVCGPIYPLRALRRRLCAQRLAPA